MSKIIVLILMAGFIHAFGQPNDSQAKIYVSRDSGVKWEKIEGGFPNDGINAWVFSDDLILAGTNMHGVWASADQGKHWYSSSKGLPVGTRIVSMVKYANWVWVGTESAGLFFTEDEGAHWSRSSLSVDHASIRTLFGSNGMFLAGTDRGMYMSTDYGKTWGQHILIQGSEPHCLDRSQVNKIISANNTLYAVTSHGVMESKDRGNTWQYIFHNKAVRSVSANSKEITVADFGGTVYQTHFDSICWLKADLLLPMTSYIKLTPASPKLLKHDWEGILHQAPTHDSGLPQEISFDHLLTTPFGLFAVSASDGC